MKSGSRLARYRVHFQTLHSIISLCCFLVIERPRAASTCQHVVATDQNHFHRSTEAPGKCQSLEFVYPNIWTLSNASVGHQVILNVTF